MLPSSSIQPGRFDFEAAVAARPRPASTRQDFEAVVARPVTQPIRTRFDFEAVVAAQPPSRKRGVIPPVLIGAAVVLVAFVVGGSFVAGSLLPVASVGPAPGSAAASDAGAASDGASSGSPTGSANGPVPTVSAGSGGTGGTGGSGGQKTPGPTTGAPQPPTKTPSPTGKPVGTPQPTPKPTPKPTAPPVYAPTVLQTTFTGSCTSGLKAFAVTIDNTASTGAVDWSITFNKSAYPGDWGSTNPTSGTLKPGDTVDAVITPAADLCSSVKTKTTFVLTVAFTQATPIDVTFDVSP